MTLLDLGKPDPLVVDLPPSTSKRFSGTPIAVARKGFSKLLDGLTKSLTILPLRR